MKTKMIIACLLVLATVAYGATQISFSLGDAYAQKLLTAFLAQDECHVTMLFRGSQNAADPNVPDYDARIDFRTPARDPNESLQIYAKRRIGLVVDAMRLAHEKKILQDALDVYWANAPVIDVNEPNDIDE